jgi:hypothetical protein
MSPAGFESAISTSEWQQIHAVESAVAWISMVKLLSGIKAGKFVPELN